MRKLSVLVAASLAAVTAGRQPRRPRSAPPPQGGSPPMRKLSVLVAAAVAAVPAGVSAVVRGWGSGPREGPLPAGDRRADDPDVYAFPAPDAPHALPVVATWIPFEDPAG